MVAAKDFIHYAQVYEELGIEFYSRLGARMRIPEIADIFSQLSDQEKQHYRIFAALENRTKPPDKKAEAAPAQSNKSLYYIASQYPALGLAVLFDWAAYHKALECEKKNILFYEQGYCTLDDETEKMALIEIIAEEKKHAAILSSIMEIGRSMVEESMIVRNDGM